MQSYYLLLLSLATVCTAQDRRPIGSYEDGPQTPPHRHREYREPDADPFTFSSRWDRLVLRDCEQTKRFIRCSYTYFNDSRAIKTVSARALYRNLALLDDEQQQYRLQDAYFLDPSNRAVPSVTLKPGESSWLVQEYGGNTRRPRQVMAYSSAPRHETPSVPVRAGN